MLKLVPSEQIYYGEAQPAERPWWSSAVIYQIYPRSFQDTNNDGIGDLRGIEERLPYLSKLGITAIWISPIFRSPMADFGYDIADYCDIDPIFGKMSDFDLLLDAAHALNIRVLIDFVPNHSSDQHPWFLESRSSRDNPKRDWYIWKDPKPDGSAPNNLVGFFGGSVWTFDETTGQYYLHMFLKEQPDLNWRNPEVVEAMNNALHFWLEKGVDGFRLDAITILAKSDPLNDLPEDALHMTGLDLLLQLTEMHNHPDLHPILRGFREILDSYEGHPVMIAETNAGTFDELIGFYGPQLDEIQLPMNLRTLQLPWDVQEMRASITEYYAALPSGTTPNFVFSNHDQSRLANRYGVDNVRAANTLLLTLWGVPTLYYGDELGMLDGHILPEQRQDPFIGENSNVGSGRDPERTPMQWNNSKNAGFTEDSVTPWLPIRTTFTSSVAEQEVDPASMLNFCKSLLNIRRDSTALRGGSIQFMDLGDDSTLLAYERKAGAERILVLVNFGDGSYSVDLSSVAEHAKLLLTSAMDDAAITDLINVEVRPHESLIIRVG